MNLANKISIASAIALFASAAVAADPIISMTSSLSKSDRASLLSHRGTPASVSYELDFVAGEKGAAVVQFDVVLKGDPTIDLSKCGGTTVAGSDHLVFCRQIAPDRVRVLVDSPTNAVVPTSSFGTIIVSGGNASIDRGSVVVGDPQAMSMTVEVL